MSGWIKLQRQILDHWIAQDNEYLAVWVRMLAEANFDSRKTVIGGVLVEVKRGQLVFGLESYSAKTGVSIRRLRKLLELLESDRMIDRQRNNKFSLITIANYEKHQDEGRQEAGKRQAQGNQTTSAGQAQGNTIRSKELKEGKEVKKRDVSQQTGRFTPPDVQGVDSYMQSIHKGSYAEAEKFVDFYSSKGWMVGKNKMKDWQAAVRNWTKSESQSGRKGFDVNQAKSAIGDFLND